MGKRLRSEEMREMSVDVRLERVERAWVMAEGEKMEGGGS